MGLQKNGHNRGRGKRNCYQIAEDTSTAIELMRRGKTYIAARAIGALNTTINKEKVNPQLLRFLLDCGARKSYLLGVDCHMKQQNINAAIETLTRAGFQVSDPSLVGGGQEPIDVEAN